MGDGSLSKMVENELSTPNFFEIAKIEEMEIRISNFWAWFLNPKGNHGLGGSFFKDFIDKVGWGKKNIKIDTVKVVREYFFECETKNKKNKKNFIDIVVEFRDEKNEKYVIGIEHKINSSEGKGQTARYMKGLENYLNPNITIKCDDKESQNNNNKIIGVYLTKWGFSVKLSSDNFKHIKYYDFNDYFNKINIEQLEENSRIIINHFKRAILDKPKLEYDYFIENYKKYYKGYNNENIKFEDNDKFLFENIDDYKDYKKKFEYYFCYTVAHYFIYNKKNEVFSDIGSSSNSSKSLYQLTRSNWVFKVKNKKYTLHIEGSEPNNLNLHFETFPYISYRKIGKDEKYLNEYNEIREKFRKEFGDEFKKEFSKNSKYLEFKKVKDLGVISFKIGEINDFNTFIDEINKLIEVCNQIIESVIRKLKDIK